MQAPAFASRQQLTDCRSWSRSAGTVRSLGGIGGTLRVEAAGDLPERWSVAARRAASRASGPPRPARRLRPSPAHAGTDTSAPLRAPSAPQPAPLAIYAG